MIRRLRSSSSGTDPYGKSPGGPTSSTTLDGVFVAPRMSDDVDGAGRSGVVVGLTLFGPVGLDLARDDRVEVDGVIYEIEGDVASWEHPMTGWDAGVTVALKRVAG